MGEIINISIIENLCFFVKYTIKGPIIDANANNVRTPGVIQSNLPPLSIDNAELTNN